MSGVQPLEIQRIQASWLKEWQKYMINTYAHECMDSLEVGCGCGQVMKNLQELVKVSGVDIDMNQVQIAREMGMSVEQGDGQELENEDSSMDLVYSCFFLMWVDDRSKAIDEMLRVARRKVIFLSEPVWTRTVYSPDGLSDLVVNEVEVIKEQGGDPDSGLELVKLLKEKGLKFRYGSVPTDTSIEETRRWLEVERNYIEGSGRNVKDVDPEMFHVPFIWAVVDLS